MYMHVAAEGGKAATSFVRWGKLSCPANTFSVYSGMYLAHIYFSACVGMYFVYIQVLCIYYLAITHILQCCQLISSSVDVFDENILSPTFH